MCGPCWRLLIAVCPLQVFLTSPTEVAKVRLQTQTQTQTRTQQRRGSSASWPSAAPPVCPAPGPKYRGPLHCLATVAREEGLRGLYKGSSALLLREGHSFATYFLSYSILSEWLTPAGHSQPGEWGLGPGGGAGSAGGELSQVASCSPRAFRGGASVLWTLRVREGPPPCGPGPVTVLE